MSHTIAIIDDDERLVDMLSQYLETRGHRVESYPDLRRGQAGLKRSPPDVLVLDLMLPDGSGLDFCQQLRGEAGGANLPIVMLSALGDTQDRIIGLEFGADDYLGKPFNPRELMARIEAVLRRAYRGPRPDTDQRLIFPGLEIHGDTRQVLRHGQVKQLTFHQFELLWKLARHPGRTYSRGQLMSIYNDRDIAPLERSIDVHISRVRAAIETNPRAPTILLTMRGLGYCFVVPEPESPAAE